MAAIKQLIVSKRNTPRNLLRLTRALNQEAVSILGLHSALIRKKKSLVLLVDRPRKAAKALDRIGFRYIESDVVQVELSARPEAAARVIQSIARKKTPISCAYRLPGRRADSVKIVVGV
jgi:hypothetical protein